MVLVIGAIVARRSGGSRQDSNRLVVANGDDFHTGFLRQLPNR